MAIEDDVRDGPLLGQPLANPVVVRIMRRLTDDELQDWLIAARTEAELTERSQQEARRARESEARLLTAAKQHVFAHGIQSDAAYDEAMRLTEEAIRAAERGELVCELVTTTPRYVAKVAFPEDT